MGIDTYKHANEVSYWKRKRKKMNFITAVKQDVEELQLRVNQKYNRRTIKRISLLLNRLAKVFKSLKFSNGN